MFTRLTATVTISAPDASCAFTITAGELYLPVPTIRRDENVVPAITNTSDVIMACPINPPQRSAADEVDDFDPIAVPHHGFGKGRTLENRQIVLDGDTPRIDLEPVEQLGHRQRTGNLDGVAVQRNLQTVFDSSV